MIDRAAAGRMKVLIGACVPLEITLHYTAGGLRYDDGVRPCMHMMMPMRARDDFESLTTIDGGRAGDEASPPPPLPPLH